MGAWTRWAAALALACWAAGPVRATLAGEAADTLEEARKAFDRKEYGRAARLAGRVIDRHGATEEAEEAHVVRIDALFEQDKYSSAFQVAEEMLDNYPRSRLRTAVLRRELKIGDAMTRAELDLVVISLSRLSEGVNVLERVIERAPFGPLADDAVLTIADAYLRAGKYVAAREQYDRLLRSYPNSSLGLRARVSRALCNYRLSSEAAYDTAPAEQAKRELEILSRVSGDEELARRTDEMRDLLAHGDYSTGLFYVRRGNFKGAVNYMEAVVAKYPQSEYADRAKRIIAEIQAARAEE
ncbi:MAG: outer membrane protein assembly factor BamD [Planctomycetota bacterium]